jgi:hypothetical protein
MCPIQNTTHFIPATRGTCDFDDILVYAELSGLFGMVCFLITVSHTLDRRVIPWFITIIKNK